CLRGGGSRASRLGRAGFVSWLLIVAFLGGCVQRRPVCHSPTTLIQRGLAWWARLPAAVHPEPLVGIAADEILDNFGEFCGVGYYVGLVIAGANQLYGGIE